MEKPNEKSPADVAEETVELSDSNTDQEFPSQPSPFVRRKPFTGKGDSLKSMAERDRARHSPANGSWASRIANLRKP